MIIALDARLLMTRHISGAEQHARNVVSQWAAMNLPHEFLLLCDKSHEENEDYDTSFIAALPPTFKPVFVRAFDFSMGWGLGGRLFNTITRTLARHKADVFHSFTPEVPRTTVCPVVQTIHDLAFELDADVRHLPESRRERRLARLGADWATRIIAVSSQTKNDIVSLYRVPAEHIAVVYNGINPAFVPRPDAALQNQLRQRHHLTRQYVLAVGSDIPRRNYSRMFDAMQEVWQADPTTRLVVAGRNEWSDTPLYRRARDTGHLNQVQFLPGPTDEELAQLYRDATVTCCASSFEGFGMSVLESMACGTPVCCSDMRSLREVADDAAVYFPHDDAKFMGQSLVGLIEDVEYRRQLKYRGLARASLFTWRTAAQLIVSLLEQTASGKR